MKSYYATKSPIEVLEATGALADAEAICSRWACNLKQVEWKTRQSNISSARHEIWRMLIDRGLSANTIAHIYKVNHTSVLYALRKGRQ